MYYFTHVFVGFMIGLIGWWLNREIYKNRNMPIMIGVLGAIAPDIDVINTMSMAWEHNRTFTHSLLIVWFFMILSFAFLTINERKAVHLSIFSVGLLSHWVLDYVIWWRLSFMFPTNFIFSTVLMFIDFVCGTLIILYLFFEIKLRDMKITLSDLEP